MTELFDSCLILAVPGECLRKSQVVGLVIGTQLNHTLEQVESLCMATISLEASYDQLVLGHGLLHQVDLDVDVPQFSMHIKQGGIHIKDLFVDRDSLEKEAFPHVHIGDLGVGLNRIRHSPFTAVQVSDLQPDANVVGVLFGDSSVCLDRFIVQASLSQFLSIGKRLVLTGRHGLWPLRMGWLKLRSLVTILRKILRTPVSPRQP